METKITTIFKEGERVYFLKDGRKETIDKTDIQFCFVSDGIVIYNDNEHNKYAIKHDEMGLYVSPGDLVFASYEEAVVKAKELNNENFNKLENVVGWIKGYYPL